MAPRELLEAYLNLGMALRRERDYAAASKILRQAIDVAPDFAAAHLALGLTLLDGNQFDEAMKCLLEAIKLSPYEDRKTRGAAYFGLGSTHLGLKNPQEAVESFRQAIELGHKTAEIWELFGASLALIDQPSAALKAFDQAITLDPDNFKTYRHRAKILLQLDRYREALLTLNQALDLQTDPWSLAHRGEAYNMLEEYDNALADLERALSLCPDYTWALCRRGDTLRLMGRYDLALENFTRVIDLCHTCTTPNCNFAIALRGEVYRQLRDYDNALADFRRALDINPQDIWVLVSRGETFCLIHEYEKALADFDQAISLEAKESNWSYYNRGIAQKLLGADEKARIDLQTAINRARQIYMEDRSDFRNTFDLAIFLLAAGEYNDAEQCYREALLEINSSYVIKQAIDILQHFLYLFPKHQEGKMIMELLQNAFEATLPANPANGKLETAR